MITCTWHTPHSGVNILPGLRKRVNQFSRFSTRRICLRDRKIQQRDWLAKNRTFSLTNHITEYLFSLLFARTNSPSGKPALHISNQSSVYLFIFYIYTYRLFYIVWIKRTGSKMLFDFQSVAFHGHFSPTSLFYRTKNS